MMSKMLRGFNRARRQAKTLTSNLHGGPDIEIKECAMKKSFVTSNHAVKRHYSINSNKLVSLNRNKAVYTATPVAGGWARAVMIRAGALPSMKYSYLNFSSFKQVKNAKRSLP